MILRNQTQQNLRRLKMLLMAALIAHGGVAAEQAGQPPAASDATVPGENVPWLVHRPLKVYPDGHSLQHADGTSFFWLGDTGWSLHQNLSRENVVRYLDDVATAGNPSTRPANRVMGTTGCLSCSKATAAIAARRAAVKMR